MESGTFVTNGWVIETINISCKHYMGGAWVGGEVVLYTVAIQAMVDGSSQDFIYSLFQNSFQIPYSLILYTCTCKIIYTVLSTKQGNRVGHPLLYQFDVDIKCFDMGVGYTLSMPTCPIIACICTLYAHICNLPSTHILPCLLLGFKEL